ncbi:MAG: AAA family ATPase, partial [Clostridiales bacterium]|nr:AAA family ATPase [Clostridiales bacterium]
MPMAKQEPALELISAKDVKVRPVKWLWPFFIPKGKITLLQGDPGDGKSTFMLTLAAYMTRGDPLPFTDYEEPPAPIKVIYQSTEDDYDDT